MIQIIAGKKGSGKTKRIIDMTNHAARRPPMTSFFIDDDNRCGDCRACCREATQSRRSTVAALAR